MKRHTKKIAKLTILAFFILSFSMFFSVASVADTSGLVAHWTFDGNLVDTAGGNNGSAIGNISYTNGVFGKGAKFDGNSYIEVPDSDSLDVSNAFTFSVWVYKEPTDEGVPFIAKYTSDPNSTNWSYGMYEWNWLKTTVFYGYDDGLSGDDVSADKPVDIQKWTLITSTYDGSNLRIYYNNTLVKTELVSGITLAASTTPLYIGFGNFMTKDQYYKGVMDDLRIYNKALDFQAVSNLYTDGTKGSGKDLVNPTDKLVAYYKFNGNGDDSSSLGNNSTAINMDGGITYINGKAGKAARLNGSSYFEVKDSDSLDIDKAYTIGVWLYKEASTAMPVLNKYGQSQDPKGMDYAYSLYDWNSATGQTLYFASFYQQNNFNTHDVSSFVQIPQKQWYYYTATYDGKKFKTYINGVLKQTENYEDFIISHSSGPLWIGTSTDTEFFKGAMDELKIYNYALDANGVKALYNYTDSIKIVPKVGAIVPATLKASKTFLFKVILKSVDTNVTAELTTGVTYNTSNSKVLKIEKGIIKAIGKGKATVSATYGPHTSSVTITVN